MAREAHEDGRADCQCGRGKVTTRCCLHEIELCTECAAVHERPDCFWSAAVPIRLGASKQLSLCFTLEARACGIGRWGAGRGAAKARLTFAKRPAKLRVGELE